MTKHDSQHGAAAIELALSMILLLMLFFAVISYGALFWAQQKMSHLAGEGARTAVAASFQGRSAAEAVELGCDRVNYLLQNDFLLASLTATPCATTSAVAACSFDTNYQCAIIRFSGQVESWPLLNIMRGLASLFTSDSSTLLPDTLSAYAVVQLNANTEP